MAEWISVKERLPDKDGKYLCCWADNYNTYMDIYSFAKNLYEVDDCNFWGEKRAGWYYYDSEWGYFEIEAVTHWMPLPDAPQKER